MLVRLNSQLPENKQTKHTQVLIWSICVCFQATNLTSLNVELGSDVHNWYIAYV